MGLLRAWQADMFSAKVWDAVPSAGAIPEDGIEDRPEGSLT